MRQAKTPDPFSATPFLPEPKKGSGVFTPDGGIFREEQVPDQGVVQDVASEARSGKTGTTQQGEGDSGIR